MGKNPCFNLHPHAKPNPNPKKKQKQVHQPAAVNSFDNARFQGNNNNYNNLESPAVTQTASGDAYSFNQTTTSRNACDYGGYLTFNVSTYTKTELYALRKRLTSELNQIRNLQVRIESGQFGIGENPRSQVQSNKLTNNRPGAAVASVPKKFPNGYDNGSLHYANCEVMLKECGKIVTKLLKHKYGYVFKVPVDVVAFGLHDYHLIVKRPMDLGTVKSNLAKSFYRTPMEFASDMRLTFNNALLYNPKSDPVNGMAAQLLDKFEELFRPIQEKFSSSLERGMETHEFRAVDELKYRNFDELQGSSWNSHTSQAMPSPVRGVNTKRKDSPVPIPSNRPSMIQQSPLMQEMLPYPSRAQSVLPVGELEAGKGSALKLRKPKAKDGNKREMSMEEKQKLGMGLESLPPEKMPQLVNIVRKGNAHLAQDGDEIELDIETLDVETLWELDRFVTNWNKMVSKTKRQMLMNYTQVVGAVGPAKTVAGAYTGAMSDKNVEDLVKNLKDNEDEDVDIDDDTHVASFPPVEIERDEGSDNVGGQCDNDHQPHVSSSSSSSASSSSDSSSSTGIDSDSVFSSCISTTCISTNVEKKMQEKWNSMKRTVEFNEVHGGLSEHSICLFTDSDSGSSSGNDSDADDAQS